MKQEGNILKMATKLTTPVSYSLPMGKEKIPLNDLIGKKIRLEFEGQINDILTGEKIKKSYNQGYSYKSSISLARCDLCILRPELCHYHKGTCREPEWGEENCFRPHYVYLANTSGIKVGITRESQIPTRWIDQGAHQALPVLKVPNRLQSGLLEVKIKQEVPDKTNWRNMLKGFKEDIDFMRIRDHLFDIFGNEIDRHDAEDVDDVVTSITYPVRQYPKKVNPLSFDKNKEIAGILQGIHGQYLLLDCGVLNIRKHQGYYIKLSA